MGFPGFWCHLQIEHELGQPSTFSLQWLPAAWDVRPARTQTQPFLILVSPCGFPETLATSISFQTTDLWVSYMQFTSDSSFSGKLNCHLWLTARFLVNLQTWKGLNKALDCGHRLLHTATLLFAFFGIAVFQSTGQSLPHSAVGACKQSHFLL